jgi:hypothetical protein
MAPRKNAAAVAPTPTVDPNRLEMLRLLDRILSLAGTPETPAPPVETVAETPARRAPTPAAAPRAKSRAFDGWKERRFTTSRRRIPAAMTPRLRSVLEFMIEAKKPVSDKQLSRDLNMTIAAARTALYHLRRNGFAEMLPESSRRA